MVHYQAHCNLPIDRFIQSYQSYSACFIVLGFLFVEMSHWFELRFPPVLQTATPDCIIDPARGRSAKHVRFLRHTFPDVLNASTSHYGLHIPVYELKHMSVPSAQRFGNWMLSLPQVWVSTLLCPLERANLNSWTLERNNLNNWTTLGRANLNHWTLEKANLSHWTLGRANLNHWNFERANLNHWSLYRITSITGP